MSVTSKIRRRWKVAVTGVVLAAAEAFFINKVSSDDSAWWWWVLLVVTLVGIAGCTVWAFAPLEEPAASQGGNSLDGTIKEATGMNQQSAGPNGTNVNVKADRGSFAANRVDRIGKLTLGAQPPGEDRECDRRP
ncbi:MAG: hypothetical protein WBB07_27480 [Mycobacterium sp.]